MKIIRLALPTLLACALVAGLFALLTWQSLAGTAALQHALASSGARNVATGGDNIANDCSQELNPCASIQYALEQAQAGDTIYIASGIYTENLETQTDVKLQGEDRLDTIIDGGGSGVVIYNRGNDLSLSNLTLRNGFTAYFYSGAGITNIEAALQVDQCLIQSNTCNGCQSGGIYSYGGAAVISNTLIADNTSTYGSGGIYNAGSLSIYASTIRGNQGQAGGGINHNFGWLSIEETTIGVASQTII